MFSCYRGACLPRSNPKENALIEKYFSAPKTLRRLRAGLSGPHIDEFAEALEHRGYSHATAIRYLRAAAHLGCFMQRKGAALADIDAARLEDFRHHLSRCRCPQSNGGRTGYHAQFGVKLFHRHLIQCGVCPGLSVSTEKRNPVPPLVAAFQAWFQTHRGVAQPTLRLYSRGAAELLGALGEHVRAWTPRPGLDLAIPAIAHWRLASLPRCLSAKELQLLIDACDGDTPARLRDRAIVLLLSRLGLRAGDVAQLRFADINWDNGTLQVMGKGRYQVRLPLPQDVGDALLRYLECRPQVEPTDRIFLRSIAPFRLFISAHCVSGVVKRALRRAGIEAPVRGAHLLRQQPPRCSAMAFPSIRLALFCVTAASTCPPTTRRST